MPKVSEKDLTKRLDSEVNESVLDFEDDSDDLACEKSADSLDEDSLKEIEELRAKGLLLEEDDDWQWEQVDNLLELPEDKLPRFTLAKNKARFLRMLAWYRQKEEWIEVAPLSAVTKLFKQQIKELESIRAHKMDYEMELEMGTLTPSQRAYRKDELRMCKVHEKLAVHLISKLQVKIKSGRR